MVGGGLVHRGRVCPCLGIVEGLLPVLPDVLEFLRDEHTGQVDFRPFDGFGACTYGGRRNWR